MKTLSENARAPSTQKHSDKADSFTGKHLQDEGVPRSTLYQTLRRKEDGKISAEKQSGSGRPAKIMTKSDIKQLFRHFGHKYGTVYRWKFYVMYMLATLCKNMLVLFFI